MEYESQSPVTEIKEREERARGIYQELHDLAHNPNLAVCLGYDGAVVDFPSGGISSMVIGFDQPTPGSHAYKDYTGLGFSEEQIKDGIVYIRERMRVEPGKKSHTRKVLFSLSPEGITAVEYNVISEGTPTTLTQEELNLVNVFSYLSLAPDAIRTEFGSYRDWFIAAGRPDMSGLNSTTNPNRRPLFLGGLEGYMRDYEKNLQNEQSRTTALREYINRSNLQQLSSPQQQIDSPSSGNIQ